jgi:2'-hydroxyisoflavone reductase
VDVRLVERGERGAFNGTGPANRPAYCWSELIAACQDEAEKRGAPASEPVPVAEDFLLAQAVVPWTELPLWIPSSDEASVATRGSTSSARSTRASAPAARADDRRRDGRRPAAADDPRRRGKLTRAREAELLARWHARPPEADAT